MNLLFVLPTLGNGGAEKHALRLANYLAEEHNVTVMPFRAGGNYETSLSAKVTLEPLSHKISSSTLSVLAAVPKLRAAINSSRFDAVLGFVSNALAALRLAYLFSNTRTLLIPCVQNNYSSELENASSVEKHLIYPLRKGCLERADSIVCLSEGVMTDLSRKLPSCAEKLTIIHNIGFDDGMADYPGSPPASTRRDRFSLIACGRLHPQKDYPSLFEAIRLASTQVDLHLNILGKGPLEGELRQLALDRGIQDKVTFLGFKDDPFAEIAKADLFVLSSRWEGFANVLVEAMACGVAVVSTNCPYGPAEVLAEGTYGLLVPTQDPEALSEAIVSMHNDPELRKSYAQKGKNSISRFSSETIGEKYSAHLKSLVQGKIQL